MSERRAPSTTDWQERGCGQHTTLMWWTNCRSTETPPASQSNVRTFPLNIDLQLSNIINRKKQTKRKEQIVVTMHSSIQFRHKATSTYRVKGWRQSLIVQLRHTACRQRYVLRGFYAWFSFLWWAESCLSIWDVFTGSWALASFSISGLLNVGILLRVVCLIKFVSQTVSPVRPWKASTGSV